MNQNLYELLRSDPVIAAVKNEDDLEVCCTVKEIKVVFVLFGDICTLNGIVGKIKDAGKVAIVHTDLISGLMGKSVAADFVHQFTRADGVISTKPDVIRRGHELGLHTILRAFLLDSLALQNISSLLATARPDMVELLPGLMPKMIHKVCNVVRIPVIAGGLIASKEDVINALDAGAIAVSSTNHQVWSM